jgi:hypothetical protein
MRSEYRVKFFDGEYNHSVTVNANDIALVLNGNYNSITIDGALVTFDDMTIVEIVRDDDTVFYRAAN